MYAKVVGSDTDQLKVISVEVFDSNSKGDNPPLFCFDVKMGVA